MTEEQIEQLKQLCQKAHNRQWRRANLYPPGPQRLFEFGKSYGIGYVVKALAGDMSELESIAEVDDGNLATD